VITGFVFMLFAITTVSLGGLNPVNPERIRLGTRLAREGRINYQRGSYLAEPPVLIARQ
jgi:hypothetical protein